MCAVLEGHEACSVPRTHRRFALMQELQTVLEKFVFFIGKNVKALFEREDEAYCFRLHKNRVFYVSERLMKRATNVRPTWHSIALIPVVAVPPLGCSVRHS